MDAQGNALIHGAACVGGLMIHESDAVETGFEIYPVYGPVPIDGAITVNVETKSWKESREVF
ncbi:hypothetical protein [Desulfoscipio sp. XC116]|uniref:hypothetical protein n=1 Tax=Desulfoscipio sp. XC116 TaxID=3144975 RepID=UPI00325C0907